MSWSIENLGKLCSFITDGKHGDCKNDEESGYYFISAKDVRDGAINYENARQIIESDFRETHRRTDLRPGDVLITNSGTIGRLAIANDSERTSRTTFQKSVAILKPITAKITSRYLYYSLEYNKRALVNTAGGAAQKNLLLGELRRFEITVPTVDDQERLCRYLVAYDDLIENNKRRIELLEESARQLYKEWFVRFRYPGHEHVKIIDGVPEGWARGSVSDLGEVITGKTPSTKDSDNFGSDIPFVKTPDMHASQIIVSPEEYLSEKGAKSQSKKTLPPFSIMVACIGARLGVVSLNAVPCQTNQQINAVVPSKEYFRFFGYCALKGFRERLLAIGGGATMPNVNKSKFTSMDSLIPKENLLENFQSIVEPNFEQMRLLVDANGSLSEARDLLLPKLMSGEIAV